jgi:hypothetical protein
MTLYRETSTSWPFPASDVHYCIEWHIPSLDEVYQIGLIFEGNTLVDYDGLYDLPKEAIALVRGAGFIVPEDF